MFLPNAEPDQIHSGPEAPIRRIQTEPLENQDHPRRQDHEGIQDPFQPNQMPASGFLAGRSNEKCSGSYTPSTLYKYCLGGFLTPVMIPQMQ